MQEEYLNEKIEVREFDQDKWKKLSEDIDYTGGKKEIEETEEDPNGEGGNDERGERREDRTYNETKKEEPPNQSSGFFEILKYLIIGVAIVLIIFLLVRLLGQHEPKNRKLDPVSEMELEKIESDLENADLKDPIQRAIASGNFALAVRLYYLALLKELSAKYIIKWKRDKTNGEYIRELAGHSFSDNFRDVTLIFERIWYGTVELNKNDFLEIEKEFENAIATVKKQIVSD